MSRIHNTAWRSSFRFWWKLGSSCDNIMKGTQRIGSWKILWCFPLIQDQPFGSPSWGARSVGLFTWEERHSPLLKFKSPTSHNFILFYRINRLFRLSVNVPLWKHYRYLVSETASPPVLMLQWGWADPLPGPPQAGQVTGCCTGLLYDQASLGVHIIHPVAFFFLISSGLLSIKFFTYLFTSSTMNINLDFNENSYNSN